MQQSWVTRYATWVVEHRFLVIIATVLFMAAAMTGMSRLSFNSDYRVFFSKDNPQLQAFERLERAFAKNDNVMFLLMPEQGDVFNPDTLKAVESLTEKAWLTPYSSRVDSLRNYQHSFATGDDLVVQDLYKDAATLNPEQLANIKSVVLSEPLLLNRLVSPTGHVTLVNVTLQLPGKNPMAEVPEVAKFARQLAEQMRVEFPHIKVYLSGLAMMNNSFSEASMKDMQTLIPLTFLVILVSLGILLRSTPAVLMTFGVILMSIMGAMGLAGWLGIQITPPSASAPTIILTLAIADAVHVFSTMFHLMRGGKDKKSAIIESLRINFQPVVLTSVTTMFGFITMNFGDVPPFRDLGNIVTMGVGIALLLSLTFLPAMAALLPMRVKFKADTHHTRMDKLADFVIRRKTALLVGMTALTIGLVGMISLNKINDNYVKYFDKSVEFRAHADVISENIGGLYLIDYVLDSQKSGGINDPQFLAGAESFATWFRAQPETIHVNGITDIMKRLNKNMHGDNPQEYRLPQNRELAAQYLLLYEMSLPYGLDMNNQINVDKSAVRMTVTINAMTTQEILALEERAKQWIQQNVPGIKAEGSGGTVMFAHIGIRNIKSMLLGSVVSLILISLSLIIAFRSLKIGLISLIPNLIPAAMAFGLWGLLVGEVGLALSVVTSMSLGIIVDDTIHFLSKYLRARREKALDSADAVRYSFHSVGHALLITTVVLMAGFLVLAFSSFKLNSGMGLLTALTLGLALIADFLLLPPLLLLLDKQKLGKQITESKVVKYARSTP